MFGVADWILTVLLIALLIFGARKLPEFARDLEISRRRGSEDGSDAIEVDSVDEQNGA